MLPDPASSAETPFPEARDVKLGFELQDDAWFARVRKAITAGPPSRIGEYEVIREIGRGGQGIVYQARQPNTGRLVALKRLATGAFATDSNRQRFLREVEASAALDHPNVVTVFGSEDIEGQPVLVMKWVDGVSISQWADGHPRDHRMRESSMETESSGEKGDKVSTVGARRRDESTIISVFLSVCDAIQHAHQRGIVHRDLKPSNILVDKDDRPHVLDFGLAKLMDPDDSNAASLTRDGFVGTLAYAAPEQFRGSPHDIDTRTDVYALGAVLHQLLTGQAPLTDLGHRALPSRGTGRFSTGPTGGGSTAELEAIVFKALSPEKKLRYSSVEALASDLRHYLTDRPVVAYSTRAGYRLGKFIRRNRSLSGLVAAAAALLAFFAIRSAHLAVKLAHEVDESKALAESEHGQRVRSEELARAAREFGSEAARQAAQHQAASEFLSGLLAPTTNPVDGKSADPPAAVLELAVQQLDNGALREQPQTEYALRFQIGSAYEHRKQYESACLQFEAAVVLARRAFGGENDKTADALSHLGAAQRSSNRLEESEKNLREAIAISDRISPAGAGATWLGELAQTLRRRGNHPEAEHYFRRSAEAWSRTRGDRNRQVAVAWQQLAREQVLLGKWQEAEASARKSVAQWETIGLSPAQVGICLEVLGHARHAQGDFSEAAACFQKVLSAVEGASGASRCSAQLNFHVAAALLAGGREDEGRASLLRAVSRCMVSEPGSAEFDSLARRVESALQANAFHVNATLLPMLGDLAWLVSNDLVLGDRKGSTMSTSAPGGDSND